MAFTLFIIEIKFNIIYTLYIYSLVIDEVHSTPTTVQKIAYLLSIFFFRYSENVLF